MARTPKAAVGLLAAVVLAVVGLAASLTHAANPSSIPSSLVPSNAQSTALYCTGLAATARHPGRVTFYNTTAHSRALEVSVVSNTGRTYATSLELGAHAQSSIQPSVVDAGANFAVAAQVNGSGVVAEQVAGTNQAASPCADEGATSWYATGFATTVGSSAYVSVYNPTATAAVFSTSVYTVTGFEAPEAYQGVSVPAHAQVELDLGNQVVNTTGVGVGVHVTRGTLVFTGVEDADGVLSLFPGSSAATTRSWFPSVTTAKDALADLDVADPGSKPATITVSVALGDYHVAPQSVTLPPFSTGVVPITPNPAIPAAGYAALAVRSSVPVVADLATGATSWFALDSPSVPAREYVVGNFTAHGLSAVRATNTSSRTLRVSVSQFGASAKPVVIELAPKATVSLASSVPEITAPSSAVYLVDASRPAMVISLTLASSPAGLYVLSPLDGR